MTESVTLPEINVTAPLPEAKPAALPAQVAEPYGVRVFMPRIEVKVLKQVQRRGSAQDAEADGNGRELDLTPFLGDAGHVRTAKSIHHPAGSFVISFPDQPHPETRDSLYAAIEPMDAIEIRGAREPQNRSTKQLPLIMRGFVSDVSRTEEMGEDGTPRRMVTIQGQDSGKLWLVHQALFEVAMLQEVPMLEQFRMQAATGMEAYSLPVSEFIRQVTERIMNKKVEALAAFLNRQFRPFRVAASVRQGTASVTTSSNIEGPIWKIANAFADRPWNELFIEDEEEGPVLRFRPAPVRGLDGNFIMPDAVDPGTISVRDDAVVSLTSHRSDGQVANFFSVTSPSGTVDTGGFVAISQLQRGEPLDFNHPNNRPELYGVRRMATTTALLPNGQEPPSQQTGAAVSRAGQSVTQWCVQRRTELRDMNRDNAVFEDLQMTLRGSEDLKIGRYLKLDRGGSESESYISQVAHDIRPFRGWTTTVTADRGTGFILRKRADRSRYPAEIGRGPYPQRKS